MLTMAACSDDAEPGNDTTLAKPQPLVFVATQDVLTTAETRAAVDGTWEGDGTELVAIKIGDEVKKYRVTSTGGTLEPCDANAPFYRSDKNDISVTAWYPYSDSEPAALVVATDQSKGLESSNLMKAATTAKYGESSTTLAFSHQAARIRSHFYKEGTTDDLLGATVKVTVTNADGSAQTEYTAHEDGSGYYSVLVAPESAVSGGADFLSITDGSAGSYKVTAPAAVTFLAGKSYEYDFNLLIPYVTFSATSEQGFKMTRPINAVSGFNTFEYSVGDGEWIYLISGEEVTFGGDNGDLRLRGQSAVGTACGSTYYSTISFTDKDVPVAASGDIRTLVDYKNYSTAETKDARFARLFEGCTVLTSAPELPAMTLSWECYYGMFGGCTSLTSAPELPATTLADDCYYMMFGDCKSLTSTPELPATTLAYSCYGRMFYGCTSLTSAPELPATTLAMGCYGSMFHGCTSLTSAPELPATTLAEWCYSRMFHDCTSLTSAPELPATTLAEWCYGYMFHNCTSLTSAPELPATALAEWCYGYMFYNCMNLKEVTIKAEGTIPDAALGHWLDDVASSGTIYKKSSLMLESNSASGIPYGWKVVEITE